MPSLIHKKADGSERKLNLNGEPLVIGRIDEVAIPVHDSSISRGHCAIAFAGDHFILMDLNSTNGTYHNGTRITECPLVAGDNIQVGGSILIFDLDHSTGIATLREEKQPTTPVPTKILLNLKTVLRHDSTAENVSPPDPSQPKLTTIVPSPDQPVPSNGDNDASAHPVPPAVLRAIAARVAKPSKPDHKTLVARRLETLTDNASPARPFSALRAVDNHLRAMPGVVTVRPKQPAPARP